MGLKTHQMLYRLSDAVTLVRLSLVQAVMIQNLLNRIVEILRQEFAGAISNPNQHIVLGPVNPPGAGALPLIALMPGLLEMAQAARDLSSSQPRPQEFTQEIPVNQGDPQGPYALTHTPLLMSALCKLILDKGTLDERRVLLQEGHDFTIDYPNAEIAFGTDISMADSILLRYSFAGVFTVQDFRQDFQIEIYEANYGAAEQWAALVMAAILTNRDELLEHYNTTSQTVYSAGVFGSAHSLTQLQPLGGVPGAAGTNIRWQLNFKSTGQLFLTRAITDGFGLIEKIRSPGHHGDFPVDIGVELE